MRLAVFLSLVALPGLVSQESFTGDKIQVLEGENKTLECMLAVRSIVWTVNKGLVSLATRLPYAHLTSDNNLTLTHVPLEAAGSRFACNDVTRLGSHVTTFLLDVIALKAPTFTHEPQSVTATLGQNVTLTCEGMGVPVPSIDWGFVALSDGFPSGLDVLPGVHMSGNNSHLTLVGLQPKHVGDYICKLHNSQGQAVSTAHVRLA